MLIKNSNQETMIVNVDWLSYSVRLADAMPELICPEGYRMEVLQGNNIYKNRFILRDCTGEKVVTCMWCPYSSVLDKNVATVQVANSWLYLPYGIEHCHDIMCQCWDCAYNGCSRVDICCDFVANDRRMRLIRKLQTGGVYIAKKREGSTFWHERLVGERKVRECHCFSWGSKKTEIKCKLYNKSREVGLVTKDGKIPETVEKQYIVDSWRKAGFDILRVWRLEFSLQGAGQLRWDGKVIDIADVGGDTWALYMYASLYQSRFDMRYNDGRRTVKHNDDRQIDFLLLKEWTVEGCTINWQEYNHDEPTPDAESITTIRKLMLQLESPAATSNTAVFDAIANAVGVILQEGKFRAYFDRCFGKPFDVYMAEKRAETGEGIIHVSDAPSKFWS